MKILVADDNVANRKLCRALIRYAGHEVIEADNGAEAIELARAHKPDLILMDIQMPVMDGISALKTLQSDEATKRIPVIALTSYAMKGDRDRFLGEGFIDYLSKPFSQDDFFRSIQTTLDRYRG